MIDECAKILTFNAKFKASRMILSKNSVKMSCHTNNERQRAHLLYRCGSCTQVTIFFILLQGFRNSVPFSRDEKPFSLDSMILPICDTRFFGLKLSLGFIEQNTNLPTHKRRWTDVNKIFLHLVWVFCFICHSQTNPKADNYGSTDPFSTNSCRTFLVLCNFCSWINKQSRKCSADVKTDSHFIF